MELSLPLNQLCFSSVRRHFFKDRRYIVRISGGHLVIHQFFRQPGQEKSPKYSLHLTLAIIVHWQFDKKGSSILIAFGMDLGGKLKWFHGSDNELGLFRKALMPFVLFSDMLSFYKPLKSLAQGGFSKVLLAESVLDNKVYAVKQIAMKTEKVVEELEVVREIEFLRRCQGPKVVRVWEVIQFEGSCFVVMEYMAGGTLDKHCIQGQLLSRALCRRVFRELLESLVLLHEAGVVHRDIKPENILLSDKLDVRIGDFGLSCEVGTASHVLGTPGYIAPEVFSGTLSSGKMDVFSAGCVFFLMLTGTALFKGSTAGQRLKNNENCDVDLEFLLVPEPERSLLMLLMHPQPEQRVSAAEALANPYFQEGQELGDKKTKENTLTFSLALSIDLGGNKGLRPREESVLPNECEAQKLPAKTQTFLEQKKA